MTPKQQRFVLEYLIDLNATQAAIRAGYAPANANVEGSRLLANANIANAIAEAQAKRSSKLEVTADRVVQEYARIAFARMSDYVSFGPDGVTVKDLDYLTPDQIAAIAEVSETKTQGGGSVRFKLHDKLRALDALSKHLGLDAPTKLAITDTAGNDVEPLSVEEQARQVAFLLAAGQAEIAKRQAASGGYASGAVN